MGATRGGPEAHGRAHRGSARCRGRARLGGARSAVTSVAVALLLGCASTSHPSSASSAQREEPIAPVVELAAEVHDTTPPRVLLTLTNGGGSPARLDDAHARLDLTREGESVPACAPPKWIRLTHGHDELAPGGERVFTVALPCALENDGEYDLLVDVVLGAEDPDAPAPVATHLATSSAIRARGGRLQPERPEVAEARASRKRTP